MLKFRQSNQKRPNLTFNELQLIALIEKGLNDNSLRGYLHKRSSPNAKWRLKWFLLFENLLFYFDFGSSTGSQLLQQPSNQPMDGKVRVKSSAFSSLINRRQANKQSKEAESRLSLYNEQKRTKLLEDGVAGLAETGVSSSSSPPPPPPPLARRASASETLEAEGSGLASGEWLIERDENEAEVEELDEDEDEDVELDLGMNRQQRLGSDPLCATADLFYWEAAAASQRKTLNSSSISGVSDHFLAHNEQSVGRSTTAAGKTASASGSYASLLSRKIGLIFLEGSYCEPLANSAGALPDLASARPNAANDTNNNGKLEDESELNCIFTLKWRKVGSKAYQFRCESEVECRTWVHAIANARYSVILNDKEQLEQKYLHLSQIIESESTAKWQYSRQCEELSAEIKKLRQEVCLLRRQESRATQLRLALTKSAAIVETIVQQQRRRQRAQQRRRLGVSVRECDEQNEEERACGGDPTVAALDLAPAGRSMQRARSMEQEQAEQELAVRRTSRCSPTSARLAREQRRESEALRSLICSAESPQFGQFGKRVRSLDVAAAAPDRLVAEAEERALSLELKSVVEALNSGILLQDCLLEPDKSEELGKIKKVQGFFRGWLCRRRWKQIVQEYIKSPHAESMRKRNNLVFRMVECEEEYVEQLTQLISSFLRPIKMAASSQRPPLSHDELNSIFLNSETLLFLHQIFLKGLAARMESWPTLVLADLFNMLLPMLTIYQEFVRNHHFSLQVLAECKQREQFSVLLRRLEEKPQLNGRTLETFLTYPMHQIPRYIICLHEILAHTPHNHVERKSLYEAQTRLEELSQQMHDEVSETENIRQNLAIERMIIGGCDLLLDVNQGILLQATPGGKTTRPSRRDLQDISETQTRQCFLFTNHLLLCTRSKDGKLHLLEAIGRISLAKATLIENPPELVQQALQRQPQQQQQQPPASSPSANSKTKNSSCNSISDCADGESGYLDTDKRASTASVPARWGQSSRRAGADKRASHVEFEDSLGVFDGCQLESKSARAKIAGYLATKLSGLANLGNQQPTGGGGGGGGGGGTNLGSSSSSSAPPSPLHRRQGNQQLFGWRRTPANASLGRDFAGCDFILLVDQAGQPAPLLLHLVAPNLQEKAAWMSDISQCIDNVHFNDLLHGQANDPASGNINQSVRTDPRLYKDDVDIKFSRALNSCKLPQIRYASIVRLFERLTDLRFLSIDFLNTFLLTYRVFTSAEDVLEALKSVHYNCDRYFQQHEMRDSFSGLADSSLISLINSNSETLQVAGEELIEPTGKTAAPTESSKTKEPKRANQPLAQKPNVPPRLAGPVERPLEESKFLSAPNQKRRSTISALTPITGSNTSSLVNLSEAKKSSLVETRVQSDQLLSSASGDSKSASFSSKSEEGISMQFADRVRSCSINYPGPNAGCQDIRLHVPAGRQVRTSSLSHSIGTNLAKDDKDPSVTFQITLEPPRAELQASDEDSFQQSVPEVPPTTPVGSVEGQFMVEFPAGENCDSRKGNKVRPSKRSCNVHSVGPPNSSLTALSSFDSGSCDANSIPSSPSEMDAARSSSSLDSVPNKPPSKAAGRSSANVRKAKRDVQTERRMGRASRQSLDASSLKGIDIAESRAADYDTSADEDKLTSSESQQTDSGTDSDQNEEDESFQILAKLNKVQLTDRVAFDSDLEMASKRSAPSKALKSDLTRGPPCRPPAVAHRELDTIKTTRPGESSTSELATQLVSNESRRARVSGGQTPLSSSCVTTPRSSFQHHSSDFALNRNPAKAGVVVSSSAPRVSSRRSSTASSASAFAAATAASNNPVLTQPPLASKQVGPAELDLSGQIDAILCSCFSSQRGSIASQSSGLKQARVQPTKTTNEAARAHLPQLYQLPHYPSCVYFQASAINTPSAVCPSLQSESSSQCNSRTSSRLSSSAGLELNNPHVSAVAQQQQQQQQPPLAQGQLGATGRLSQGQVSRASVSTTLSRSPASRSKRNSTQINIRSVATIRVLSVLRHWVSKHSQDFVNDAKLTNMVQEFLHDLITDPSLLPAEHKAAVQLDQMVQKAAHSGEKRVDLDQLLRPPAKPSPDSIETLSALEIAEGMTYLDHRIFLAIRSEEFLGQAWMKVDKAIKAPHILLITKRFNDVSRLVSSEIIRVSDLQRRVAVIEKWTNVAHICRVVHNFNGVLQICAAFTNSAVFRLKKTWDKIPKTTRATIDQLQNLVSTDSRFRNMRDAINRCDPPSIPYVGMYLTDLSFIEEGTPNYSPDGLLNFSKMRMIAHVIREIQHLQNGSYKIELNKKVSCYLLDSSRHLQDDEMYRCSLAIEPRSSGGKNGVQILNSVSSQGAAHNQVAYTGQSKVTGSSLQGRS